MLSLIVIGTARATAQQSDILVVDGQEFALTSNPLEVLFESEPDEAAEPPPDFNPEAFLYFVDTHYPSQVMLPFPDANTNDQEAIDA